MRGIGIIDHHIHLRIRRWIEQIEVWLCSCITWSYCKQSASYCSKICKIIQ